MTTKQGLVFGLWVGFYYLMGMVILPAINPEWRRPGPWFNLADVSMIVFNFFMAKALFPEERRTE